MIRNYFIVALRNIYRNKLFALVKVIGLGVAMAMCVVGYINHQFGKSYNNFHENAEDIYLVNVFKVENETRQDWTYSPVPLGPIIKDKIPGIEKMSRYSVVNSSVRHGDKVFDQNVHFADPDFFDMFTFPLIQGAEKALANKNDIIISDLIAEKYFGEENPIGKVFTLCADGENYYDFMISGVMQQPPKNSSLPIHLVVPFENIDDLRNFPLDDWAKWSRTTFIQIAKKAPVSEIEEQLQAYLPITRESNEEWQVDGFFLTHLPELAAVAHSLNGHFFESMHPAAMVAPSITALLVLLLACFNFINTAIATAAKRMNEIGIRKVLGGVRSQLVTQFLGENLILCIISIAVAALLAEVFVPLYDGLWPNLSLSLDYTENLGLVGFMGALLLFTVLAAGAYPAFYVSRFQPVEIIKGKQKLAGTNPVIRVLLTFQIALSMTTLISAFILSSNAEFMKNFDFGFAHENVLLVPVKNGSQYELMKNAVRDYPDIKSLAGTRHMMSWSWWNADIEVDQKKTRAYMFQIGDNYFETMGFKLVEGRLFDKNLESDIGNTVIINEKFAEEHGWRDPIGKRVKFLEEEVAGDCQVIGVVKDFYQNSFWSEVKPTALRYVADEDIRMMAVRCDADKCEAVSAFVQDSWKKTLPHLPYAGFWQEETYAETNLINNSIRLLFNYIAVLVVIISTMGLFALVSLNIARRRKEIGIRKVLGATLSNIGSLIAKEFLILTAFGTVMAAALGYFLTSALLSSIYAFYMDIGVSPFVVSAVLVFSGVIFTIIFQVMRASNTAPVESIRTE